MGREGGGGRERGRREARRNRGGRIMKQVGFGGRVTI